MKALAAALVEAQKEMPAVEPDAVNPHFNSKFVSLDHLIAKTKPVLTKHGLTIVQLPSNIDGAPALTTTILHAASGESISDTLPLVLDGQNMQKLGGALTYARRYAWAAALGICDETDDDGNQASAPVGGTAAGASHSQATAPAADGWTFPFGKHKGKTIAAVDAEAPDYLDWFLQKSDKQDIKDRITAFRSGAVQDELEATFAGGGYVDDDIPFKATVDGVL